MDLNDFRSIVTVLGLLLFLGLAAWTWHPARRRASEAAARLPFEGDATEPGHGAGR